MIKNKSFFFTKIYFLIIFFFSLSNVFRFYKNHEGFRFGDWLINYEGGFVRRGFFGSFLIQLSNITQVNIDTLYLLIISFFYSIFLYLFFILVKKKINNINYLFLLLSPLSVHYIVFQTRATAGKELILFLFFIILIFLFIKKIRLLYIFLYFHVFLLFLILTYEGIFFYLVFVYFFIYLNLNKKNYHIIKYNIFFSATFLIIVFFILFYFSGNELQVKIICNFLDNKDIKIRYCDNLEVGHSAIAFLGAKKTFDNIYISTFLDKIFNHNYLITYSISFLISFFPVFYFSNNIKIKKNFLKLSFNKILILCLLFTLPLFIAFDWGRWLHISYILIILIIFSDVNHKYFVIKKIFFLNKLNKKYILIIFLFYFILIDVPICCTDRISSPVESIYNRFYYFINK
jgi:hypothetical protein